MKINNTLDLATSTHKMHQHALRDVRKALGNDNQDLEDSNLTLKHLKCRN